MPLRNSQINPPRKRILSGDRPTSGAFHLGNYVGTLANRVRLQDEYETFLLLADLHLLTTRTSNLEEVGHNIQALVLDYLSVGIDHTKTTIFLQSLVPEVLELTWIFSALVSVPRAQRIPTLKEQVRDLKLESASMALLTYPILEGKAKMGKSLGNAIFLSDDAATVERKVMTMYTDPTRIHATDPGHVKGNPVFVYHDAFNDDKEELEDLKRRYRRGKVGDVDVKKRLAAALNRFLDPIRERRAAFAARHGLVDEIIREGSARARQEGQRTLSEGGGAVGPA